MNVGNAAHGALCTAEHLEARSRLFQCFAEAFTHPGDDFLTRIFGGEFLSTLGSLGNRLPYPTPFEDPASPLVPQGMEKQDIRVFFTTTFESGHQGVSLRELAYSSLTEKALLEDVLRFYQHFGLGLSKGELREPPDSLPVELEFLHYLTYLEANAQKESGADHNSAALQRAQRDFIDRHIGAWVRPFMLKLKGVPDNGFYAGLADLMACFLESEQHFFQTHA
jgi:DMSO reductase family type II enzyme chaperone